MPYLTHARDRNLVAKPIIMKESDITLHYSTSHSLDMISLWGEKNGLLYATGENNKI